jgi:hypothetical protein
MLSNHDDQPRPLLDLGTDGRHPPRATPPNSGRRKRLRKSVYYGYLLFILEDFRVLLHEDQVRWIIYYARRLSEAELLKAGKLATELKTSEIAQQRSASEIVRIFHTIPRLRKTFIPIPRRIGTGYHDKGALRPRHKPRLPGAETFWSQDIDLFLPTEEEGKWITSDEVLSLIGIDLQEMIRNNLLTNRTYEQLALTQI